MVRAFNDDERTTFWQYLEPGQLAGEYHPGDSEVWGIPLSVPSVPKPGDLFLDTDISLESHGVNQVRVVAGGGNSLASFKLPGKTAYGVSFQNGTFSAWKDQPETMYVYIPPHAETLQLAGGPVRVFDETGKERVSTTGTDLSKPVEIPVSVTKVVWRVEFPKPKDWQFRAAGFPFILCQTPEAARAIHASVEELPDGTVVCHKFQRRIAELLPKLLAPEKVGRAQDLIVPLSSKRKEWLNDPERSALLLSSNSIFGSIEDSLKKQNVDPTSHWGGSISGWEEHINLPTPQNRWDRLKSVDGLWAGASSNNGSAAENLAQAALIDAPFNPYFGKKELLNRAAAASLRDLMVMGEDEVWRGVCSDLDSYPGAMSFPVAQKTFPVYALVAPHMSQEVRDVWTEGLRHIVDRSFPDGLVTCRNQSSHYLEAYQCFANGSGDPRYFDLARVYARRFAAGASAAGYHMEQSGPDGSYIGMTHWHMAVYYRESNDPVILAAIKKSYQFFNHTVAPEPDGNMLGGFNFNHRIGTGFYGEQWGGARGILDDVLPEVGLWAMTPKKKKDIAEDAKRLSSRLDLPSDPKAHPSDIGTPRYLYWHAPNTTGVWPAREKNSFTRNISNELIAIKRSNYYAVVYVGKAAASPFYISAREHFRDPFLEDAENKGAVVNVRKITPFLGGGLSMFWTPEYGSSILGANWSPLTHHGLVATGSDGKRSWEDYFSTHFVLNEDPSELTITGKIENQPLTYTRRYLLGEQELGVELEVTADKDVQLTSLQENLPIAAGSIKSDGAQIRMNGEDKGQAKADKFVISDSHGQGVEVVFNEPQWLFVQRNGLQSNDLQVARVDVELPAQIRAGQTVRLSYIVRPLKKAAK